MPTGNVYINYKYFNHAGAGDFFSVESYDSNGSGAGLSVGGYEKIPGHKGQEKGQAQQVLQRLVLPAFQPIARHSL